MAERHAAPGGGEAFEHDAGQFVPASDPDGVRVPDAESKYADLFAEAIWDGVITADKRQRLQTAAEVFGLNQGRAVQIEVGLRAAYEAEHHLAVIEEGEAPTIPLAAKEAPPTRPDDPDPRLAELTARIDVLEADNARLFGDKERLTRDVERLEQEGAELRAAVDAARVERRGLRSRRSLTPKPAAAAPPPAAQAAPVVTVRRNDPAELHRLVRKSPRDADLLKALYKSLARGDDGDRRWCIAHALVYLGEANANEQAHYEKHAKEALVRPSRAVNDDEWHELLAHPDEDALTGEILAEIAPAVLLGHLTTMRASIAPDVFDPSQLADPRKSTMQAVRCMAWAAAALGTALPAVYVCPEVDITADLILDPRPATRLGKKALAGRTPRELAFMTGQHLTWYRKEHLLGKPAASTRRLEDMFVAALSIGNAALPMTDEIRARVTPIASSLRPLLGDGVKRLERLFQRFVAQGGRTNLMRWLAGVGRTSACAGLLLCDDLRAAEAVLRLEGADVDGVMSELIVFLTAGRCSLLRKRIGIAVATGSR